MLYVRIVKETIKYTEILSDNSKDDNNSPKIIEEKYLTELRRISSGKPEIVCVSPIRPMTEMEITIYKYKQPRKED